MLSEWNKIKVCKFVIMLLNLNIVSLHILFHYHKTWRKVVSRKTLKKIELENFRSEYFSIRTSEGRAPASELVLQRGSLSSEIALQGGSL